MNHGQKISISTKDMYQLLISDLRYGYTRNNHLMPGVAYDRCKQILPEFYAVDPKYSISTAKQLCEECISDQICKNFYSGEDDEDGNRREAIAFVQWLMKWIKDNGDAEYLPYCYDDYILNLNKDKEKIYRIYEIIDGEKILFKDLVSREEYVDSIFKPIVGEDGTATYGYERIDNSYWDNEKNIYVKKPADFKFRIFTPVRREFFVENIKDKK